MKIFLSIKYYHPGLSIGLEDVRNAWYLPGKGKPLKLKTVIHQGRLAYRFPVSGQRISYRTLKRGLIRKKMTIRLPLELLPF
jgi:hypothetical protein